MTEKEEEISARQWLCCTIQFVAIGHVAVQPVANWLIVTGGQCGATQDAGFINNKHVLETLLLRKHLPCYAIITIV